jgi:lysophospholipase L1-like esterase
MGCPIGDALAGRCGVRHLRGDLPLIDRARVSRRVGSAARLLLAGLVLWCGSFGILVTTLSSSRQDPTSAVRAGQRTFIAIRRAAAAATPTVRPASVPTAVASISPSPEPAAPSAAGPEPAALSPAPSGDPMPAFVSGRFVVLGDSLSAWAFDPGSRIHSADGVWPSLLAAQDPLLSLANNAGVPGNTTGQMLARLQRDVLDYDPDILFVLGGTNDVGQNVSEGTVIDNIRTIVQRAQDEDITVVLMTMPPTNGQYQCLRELKRQLNVDLADLARSEGVLLVDVDAALSTPRGDLAPDYAAFDGLHLTRDGERAVADAVYRALRPADLPRR